jgi:hypothetical protein
MLLLAKADMLTPDERITASQYIQEQVLANVGTDLPVHIVSVKGRDAVLCDRWFETALVPCLREHRELARGSLRRKVGLLREAAISVLKRRLDKGSAAGEEKAKEWPAVEASLNEALARLDVAMRETLDWSGLAERILGAAAQQITDKWRRDHVREADAATAIISCGSPEVTRLASEVAKPLELLRENLTNILRQAAFTAGLQQDQDSNIPQASGMPILDLSAHLRETPLPRPRLAFLSRRVAYWNARRKLEADFRSRLTDLLDKHVRQMEQWRLRSLAEMRQAFTARAGFYRVQCEQTSSSLDRASIGTDIQRLQGLPETGG